jgi:histidyl-tRNA synthetase
VKYKAVRGMGDILPQNVQVWQELERKARKNLTSYGYKEIRTPIVEDTSVFTRSIGETTDIVAKEMYTFKDKKGRSLTLRPEGTAPIVRAYVEHSLHNVSSELKLYYMGPMFRSERPQKGRSRQFHQIGVEVIGSGSSYADAEVIIQLNNMLKYFGLEGFIIKLNSLGCADDKVAFAAKLKKYLKNEENRLCNDCKKRIKKNVLRTLDCKNECCVRVLRGAPNILDSLCERCRMHFHTLKFGLKEMKVKFQETKNLVRGLDYYTGTVFEITHPALGSQDAIGAGGRYDKLVKDFGGPDVGAVGYAIGIERIIIALKKAPAAAKIPAIIYVATQDERARIDAIQIAEIIRMQLGLIVLTNIKEKVSLKSQMRSADKNKARFVIILGENELKENKLIIRDMVKKEQYTVARDSIVDEIKKRTGDLC